LSCAYIEIMHLTAATAVIRYALGTLDRQGADSGALARRLGLPVWALRDNTARMPIRDDLELPLPGADPGLARLLLAHADSVLGAPPWTPDWRDLFREILSEHLADPDLSLPVVARRMALSPRTLLRRLEREGTSWRAEIDALRQEEAARLLGQRLSREAAAARLGYADTRALRRALHRWKLASSAR